MLLAVITTPRIQQSAVDSNLSQGVLDELGQPARTEFQIVHSVFQVITNADVDI